MLRLLAPGLRPQGAQLAPWVDRGNIEDAARYERKEYPHTAYWDWFQYRELAALRRRHTILDKMLDPALLGAEVSQSRQWVFTRVSCPQARSAPTPISSASSFPRARPSAWRSARPDRTPAPRPNDLTKS